MRRSDVGLYRPFSVHSTSFTGCFLVPIRLDIPTSAACRGDGSTATVQWPDWRGWLNRHGLYVAVAMAALLCGCGSSAGATTAPAQRQQDTAPASLSIVLGEDIWTAEVHTATDQPSVSRERALETAHAHAPTWQQATAVSARYVTLNVRASDGTVSESLHDRPVWLVTFTGATYDPPGACACAE